jgi:hypothetical protein
MLLHEYYLTDDEGKTIFLTPVQSDKISILIKNATQGAPTITDDIDFGVPDSQKSTLSNYHLKIVQTYTGFKILTEVQKLIQTDGTTLFKPIIPLPDDLNIVILLSKKNNLLNAISNARMKTNLPSVYYFSNALVLAAKTVPVLSNPIPNLDSSYAYEFGELAMNAGALQQYITPLNNATTSPWIPVTGDIGFANEADKLLVPMRFDYSFDLSDNIFQADFILQNGPSNLTPTLSFTGTTPLQKVNLDFSTLTPIQAQVLSVRVSPVVYTLKVSGSNSYSRQFNLIFTPDDMNLRSSWGLVNIQPGVKTAGYNLLDDSGYLLTQISSAGNITAAPIFEIRIKSRPAYWRYINDKNQTFDTTSIPTSILTSLNSGENLVTVSTRIATATPTMFETGANSFENLPNPDPSCLLMVENGQFFKDILVPESDLFPVETT